MPNYKVDYTDLDVKVKKVDEVTKKLKGIFFGIDEQIDQLMDAFKNWYLFPQFQERPIVINLYGMTGVGKTDLVNKLIQFMELEKDKIYYNFAAIDELRAFEVEDDVEEDIYEKNRNKIFVLDEFQYAATLDEEGCEKKNRSALKPFWEIIDTGIFHKRMSYHMVSTMSTAIKHLVYINNIMKIELDKGVWVNEEDCLALIDPWLISSMANVLNIDRKKYCGNTKKQEQDYEESKEIDKLFRKITYHERTLTALSFDSIDSWTEQCILSKDTLAIFHSALHNINYAGLSEEEFYHKLQTLDGEKFIAYLKNIHKESMKGYNVDMCQSIIFVIANLDEAYKFSYDVDPDMPPDQFRKMSEKITIIDIKKALQKRFRNEQIARLGNIHIIYPSFNTETFNKIIQYNLDTYAKHIKTEIGINLTFDKSINDILFKEGVFATQGTRPLFSTIYEVVKSKFPAIIRHTYLNNFAEDYKSIRLSYHSKHVIATYYNEQNKKISTLSMPQMLRVEGLRKNTRDNNQAISALHESGHFVVHYALTGILPEKIVSRAANSGIGGFVLHSVDDNEFSTKTDFLNFIQICLGGYVAERLFFGDDDRTIGASSDLANATQTTIRMIRYLGMYYKDYPYVITKLDENADTFIYKENQDDVAQLANNIIKECIQKVENIFRDPDWRGLLKKSAKYLSTHNLMKPNTMKRLCKAIPKEKKATPRDNNFYMKLINEA